LNFAFLIPRRGGDRPHWRPNELDDELFGSRVRFCFPIVKLLDYRSRWGELEGSGNLFATVVMAHLKALETRSDRQERQQWKIALTRRLYEGGFAREDVINLFHFIDWLMSLPEELDREFWEQISQIEEEKRMRYVTSVERRAKEEEAVLLVTRQLHRLLGTIAPEVEERVRRLPVSRVEDLGVSLFDFNSEADLVRWLDGVEN